MHAWLEKIEWLDDGRPDEQVLRDVAAGLLSPADNVDELLAQFERILKTVSIARLLHREMYEFPGSAATPAAFQAAWSQGPGELSVHNERRFAIRRDDALLNGSIDRLVLLSRDGRPLAAEIVDFKTDVLDPSDPTAVAEKIDFYQPQLHAYRLAISQSMNLPQNQITARLAFVGCGLVCDIGPM
jgi:ATP-dependent exoDNAse (exonuclease V) beta subunit